VGRKKKKPELFSIVVPAYRQEKTIKEDLLRLIKALRHFPMKYEIIVVVDGRVDKTEQRVKSLKSRKIVCTAYKTNKGKGHAVRYGMAKAKGNIVAFIDAGMDLNPNGLSMLLAHYKWYNADIIVGSKLHPVSKVRYPWWRKVLSVGYRLLVKIMFGLSIKDTQVGIKIFRKQVLEDVLPKLLVKTYAFDIEILAVANSLGYTRIFEAPIELEFNDRSSIVTKGFWRTIFYMLWDTLAVFYRLRIVRYYDRARERPWKYDKVLKYKVNLP
jgi:glycosyltransferase involved in cell wall biosynthesis